MTEEEAATLIYGQAFNDNENKRNDQDNTEESSEDNEEVAVTSASKVSSS